MSVSPHKGLDLHATNLVPIISKMVYCKQGPSNFILFSRNFSGNNLVWNYVEISTSYDVMTIKRLAITFYKNNV